MKVFVDTSALFALLDADQTGHSDAAAVWTALLEDEARLVTTNYVLLETIARSQHRLGVDAVREVHYTFEPLLQVVWIDEEVHRAALSALLASRQQRVSLVDRSSFEVMNRRGIMRAFALDTDFAEEGFEIIPSPSP